MRCQRWAVTSGMSDASRTEATPSPRFLNPFARSTFANKLPARCSARILMRAATARRPEAETGLPASVDTQAASTYAGMPAARPGRKERDQRTMWVWRARGNRYHESQEPRAARRRPWLNMRRFPTGCWRRSPSARPSAAPARMTRSGRGLWTRPGGGWRAARTAAAGPG